MNPVACIAQRAAIVTFLEVDERSVANARRHEFALLVQGVKACVALIQQRKVKSQACATNADDDVLKSSKTVVRLRARWGC